MKKTILAIALFGAMSFGAIAGTEDVKLALDNHDLTSAELAFEQLTDDEMSSVDGKVLSGRILLDKDETEDAFEHFEDLRDNYKDNVDVNYYLGVSAMIMAQKASIFSKLGYAEDFLEAMEKTVELQNDHMDALNTLVGFHLVAPGIAGGDKEKALSFANKIKALDEEQGYSQLANVYWQTDRSDLADQMIMEGLKKYPESGKLYFARATKNMREEAWDKARPDLAQAIKFSNNDDEKSRALYQQGKASAESGDEIELGIEVLTQALPLADEQYEPWVKYRLAQLYVHNKQLTKAKESLASINIGDDDDLKSKVKKLKKKLKKTMS